MNKHNYGRCVFTCALCLLSAHSYAQKKQIIKTLTNPSKMFAGVAPQPIPRPRRDLRPQWGNIDFTNASGLKLNPHGLRHSLTPSALTILGSDKVQRPSVHAKVIGPAFITPSERAKWRELREEFIACSYYRPIAKGKIAYYLRHSVPPQTFQHIQEQYAKLVTQIHNARQQILPTVVYASLPGEGNRLTSLEIGKVSEIIYPIINTIRELGTALEHDIFLEKQLETWEHAFAAFNPLLASLIISPAKAMERADKRVLNTREFNLYNPDGTDYLLPRSETLLVDPEDLEEMDSYAAVREKMRNPPIKPEDAEKERAALLEQIPSGLRIALINDDTLPRINFESWGKKGYLGRGAKIEVFPDGNGFMEQIRNGVTYDLVITDLLVPYGGIAMMPQLRAKDSKTIVIASSKFDRGEEDEEKLFNLGFDGYLWYNTNLNEGAYGYIEYLRALKNYFYYKQKYNWQR